jgi:NADPH-dependent 2,4-dienoyl-CoA reductase/sulfur reductase-like enzyme
MPYFISGVTADHNDLVARRPEEFKEQNGIDVMRRHRALGIDTANHTARITDLESGRERDVDYTKLLISTGASSFVPPVDGIDATGVFTLRRLSDSIMIKQFISGNGPRRAVIVGSGPIGVEMCESFRRLGMEVSLIELADQVLPIVDGDVAGRVQRVLESEGVDCQLGQQMLGVEVDGKGRATGVVLGSRVVPADIVLMALGVRPLSRIASEAGIELGTRGAIRVDSGMRTSAPDIYAAGDCATTTNVLTGEEAWIPLGSTARKQGRVAAESMFGGEAAFPGVQGTAVVKCFDLTVGRTGLDEGAAEKAGFDPVTVHLEAESLHSYYPGRGEMYLKMTADRRTGRVLGAQVAGELRSVAEKRLDILAVAISCGMRAEDMRYLDLAYAPPYSTAMDIPVIAADVMASKLGGARCSCDSSGLE